MRRESHLSIQDSRIERRDSPLVRIAEAKILEYYQTKVSHEKKNTCHMMRLSVPFLKWPVPTVDDSVVHVCLVYRGCGKENFHISLRASSLGGGGREGERGESLQRCLRNLNAAPNTPRGSLLS